MATPLAQSTIIVTGAAGGLGSRIAAEIASSPQLAATYHGLYTVREASTATTLINTLKQKLETNFHHHEVVALDLERLDHVRDLAGNINKRVAEGDIPRIRALVLSAGYLELDKQSWLENGLDTTWVVNYLSQWLLTLLLLQSMDPKNGRIVVLGSHSHDPHDAFNQGSMGGQYDEERWKTILGNSIEAVANGTWSPSDESTAVHAGLRRYGASKLCLAMMIGELQQRLDRDPLLKGIIILGIDPGWMATSISRRHPMYSVVSIVMPWVAGLMSWLQPSGMYRTPNKSAKDVVAAALGIGPMSGTSVKGEYFKGLARTGVSAEAQDPEKRRMVWKGSIKYAGLQHGDTALQHWN
ncbi:NAD(P)-binding protein [Nemania sp. FL0916]|nr:NAD(P)-binding protein [Nemania sp. FL0916]